MLLKKSFSTADQNFCRPLMRFSDKYVRGTSSPSEKLTGGFDNGLGAILIGENSLASFLSKKSPEGISGLFQQHRPKPEVERPILLCCTTECRAEHGARSRWRRNDRAHRRAASPAQALLSPIYTWTLMLTEKTPQRIKCEYRTAAGGRRPDLETFQDYPGGWHRLWLVVLRGLDRPITRRPYTGSPHSKRGMIGSVITSTRPAFARVART